MTAIDVEQVRCALWTREHDVDPIGSAGGYRGFLVLEWPLPWPRDVSEIPELAPLRDALAGREVRLQCVVPLFEDPLARRAVLYHQPADADEAGAGAFLRAERIVPAERLVEAAAELVRTGVGDPEVAQAAITDDVLVCTHGRRDRCCGSMGTALVQQLSKDPARFAGPVRLWRTSHTGGHRFAPTAIVLPQGTAWAFVDDDALRRIVARSGPLDDLLPRYRGFTGLRSPALQALDRAAFGEVGWTWLDHRRRGEELDEGRVRLHATAPDGAPSVWEGVVEVRRVLPVPDCGHPISEAKKTESELRLVDAGRVS